MTIPSVRLLLARVNCRTMRSKPCKSKTTRSSPRLIDSSDWLEQIGNQRGDPPQVFGGAHGLTQDALGPEPPEHLFAEKGVKLRGDVEMRVETATDRFDGHERTDQECKVGRNGEVVGPNDPDEVAKQDAQVDRIEREVRVSGDELGDIAAEAAGIGVIAADIERFECTGSRGRRPGQAGRPAVRRSARGFACRDVRRRRSRAERSPLQASTRRLPGCGSP